MPSLRWWKARSNAVLDVLVSGVLMTASFSEHSDEGEPARFDLKEDKEEMDTREDMDGGELGDGG